MKIRQIYLLMIGLCGAVSCSARYNNASDEVEDHIAAATMSQVDMHAANLRALLAERQRLLIPIVAAMNAAEFRAYLRNTSIQDILTGVVNRAHQGVNEDIQTDRRRARRARLNPSPEGSRILVRTDSFDRAFPRI